MSSFTNRVGVVLTALVVSCVGWQAAQEIQATNENLHAQDTRPAGPPGGAPQGGAPFGPPRMADFDPVFRALDTNKDGEISSEEIAAAAKSLQGLDKNKDGQLTADEFTPSFGGMGGPGFGPPMQQEIKLLAKFDDDKDGILNKAERAKAREDIKNRPAGGFGPGGRPGGGFPGGPGGGPGFGGPGGRGEETKPGPKVSPADVKNFPEADLYEPTVLRTLFIEFENSDWESELEAFHNSDVEVPATLTVDGKKYPNVGLHFRGMSSYGMVRAGQKRSLNLSLDVVDSKQRLLGYKTLNLLNAHEDSSFLSTVLYSHIARKYMPAPKANFVKVVINGESWGVYANVQQFNKEFLAENYKSAKGTRWKVRGSPAGGGGLDYISDNIADYERRYEMKSGDSDKAWKALISLCKTLKDTPTEELEAALKPILDIDSLLWFLALDVSLINNDGYWVRASDYSIFRDEKGVFHILPHDMNEALHGMMGGPGMGGPGMGGPGGGRGGFGPGGFGGGGFGPPDGGARTAPAELDPLVGLEDARKPLRSRILSVPAWRALYLQHVRQIAEESLDWKNLGPVVAQYRSLIEPEIAIDTRKLSSLAAFQRATADNPTAEDRPQGRPSLALREFADQRRAYLLKTTAPK